MTVHSSFRTSKNFFWIFQNFEPPPPMLHFIKNANMWLGNYIKDLKILHLHNFQWADFLNFYAKNSVYIFNSNFKKIIPPYSNFVFSVKYPPMLHFSFFRTWGNGFWLKISHKSRSKKCNISQIFIHVTFFSFFRKWLRSHIQKISFL